MERLIFFFIKKKTSDNQNITNISANNYNIKMERINNFNNNFIKSNRNSKSANKNNNNKYGNDRYQNITIIKKNNLKSSLNKDQKINQDSIKDLPKKDILKALLFFKIIYNSFLKIKSSIFFSIMKYNFNKKEEELKNKFILP